MSAVKCVDPGYHHCLRIVVMFKKTIHQSPQIAVVEQKPPEIDLKRAFQTGNLEAFRQALAKNSFRLGTTSYEDCTLFDAQLAANLDPVLPDADNTPLLVEFVRTEHRKSGLQNLIEFDKFAQGLLERGQIQYYWDVLQAYMSGTDHTSLHDYNVDLCKALIPIVSSVVLHQLLQSFAGLTACLEMLADLSNRDPAIQGENTQKLRFVSISSRMMKRCIEHAGNSYASSRVKRENTIRAHNHREWLSLPLLLRLTCALDDGDLSWLMKERDPTSLASLRTRTSRSLSTLQERRKCTMAETLVRCRLIGSEKDSDEQTLVDVE